MIPRRMRPVPDTAHRSPLRAVAVVVLVLSLGSACSSSGGSSAAGTAQPRAAGTPSDPRPASSPRTIAKPSPEPLDYVALGDSIPAGVGARTGYPQLVAADLAKKAGTEIRVHNLAVSGFRTADLLQRLRQDERYRTELREAEVVTVTIGGNDLTAALRRYVLGACGADGARAACIRAEVEELEAQWEEVLRTLRALLRRDAIVRVTNYYNPFVGNPLVEAFLGTVFPAELRELEEQHNQVLCAIAERYEAGCADVHTAFHGADGSLSPFARGLLAVDAFHPSDLGQRLIAETLGALGFEPMG